MYSAFIRVTDPSRNDRQLGATRLRDLGHFGRVATHLGDPVIRVRERGAQDFRAYFRWTCAAIEAQGYHWHADLTAAAQRALAVREGR